MFVTCLYAILDPQSGLLRFANAGHDLPYRYRPDGVDELRARGMPLGLMPGMTYEEKEIVLAPRQGVLFYSDGLVEAHNPARDMFSFGRLQQLLALKAHQSDTLTHVLLAYGLNEHYQHIFELTRLNEAIGVYGSEAEALAAA